MHTLTMRRCVFPLVVSLIAIALPACAGAQDSALSDIGHALQLLRQAGLPEDATMIQRVLRDEFETVVWVEPRVRGLPMFNRQQGYVFEADGRRQVDPFTGQALMLGDSLPADSGGVSVEPSVTADRARTIYLGRAQREGAGQMDPSALDAVLGFAEGPEGRPYVLAWRVRPRGAGSPEAIIDATDGRVLFYDSGIRCVRAPCP